MTHDGSHAAFRQLAAIAVDFELAPDQRRELDAHLAGCAGCRRFAAALAGDRALLRDRRREVPSRRLDDVVLALDGTAGWSRPTFRPGRSWAAVAVALLSLALLASVAFVGARLLLRPPVTDVVQPGPAQPLGDLPLLGSVAATIPVPVGNAARGHDCHIIPASGCATAVAATDDAIWATTTNGIARIDPTTNRVVTTIPLGDYPRASRSRMASCGSPSGAIEAWLRSTRRRTRSRIGSPWTASRRGWPSMHAPSGRPWAIRSWRSIRRPVPFGAASSSLVSPTGWRQWMACS